MKIREKGAEREEWKRREAHAYTIGERGRVAVGESCVSVPCGDMMFVMRVCVFLNMWVRVGTIAILLACGSGWRPSPIGVAVEIDCTSLSADDCHEDFTAQAGDTAG